MEDRYQKFKDEQDEYYAEYFGNPEKTAALIRSGLVPTTGELRQPMTSKQRLILIKRRNRHRALLQQQLTQIRNLNQERNIDFDPNDPDIYEAQPKITPLFLPPNEDETLPCIDYDTDELEMLKSS